MKNIKLFIVAIFSISTTYAQVGINADNSAPHSSAQLDVKSTTKAFYPPRMTTAQKNAIASPQAGAVVFDNTLNQLSFYNGSSWVGASGSIVLPYVGTGSELNENGLLKIENTATTGTSNAIVGNINSQGGAAISGYAKHPTPTSKAAGVAGYNEVNNFNIPNTFGVYGYTVRGEAAIYGEAIFGNGTVGDSQNGAGLVGRSYYSDGVRASSHDSYGIYASSTAGTAGYFQGSNIGFALKTDGRVRIGGINVGALGPDKLLKSINNNGDAEWADFLPFSGTTTTNQHSVSFKIINSNYDIPSYPIVGETTTRFNGTGISGLCSATSPVTNNIGVQGSNNSTNNFGYGVSGQHGGGGVGGYFTAVSGKGISSKSTSGIGGFFESTSGYSLITGNGNVGIGTLTPAAKMDIQGSANLTHFYFGTNEDTYIRGGKGSSHVIINDNAGYIGLGVMPNLNADERVDINARLRIRSGLSTSGVWFNNSSNSKNIGDGAFYGMITNTQTGIFIGGAWRFSVYNNGDANLTGIFSHASDKRLKKDIVQLNYSLSNIYKLNGYHYNWKDKERSQNLQTGLIAQEVQKIFPELVQTDDKGFLSVNYIGLIPHLLEAVKELKNENDSLKKVNGNFENRLEKLEQLVNFSAKK